MDIMIEDIINISLDFELFSCNNVKRAGSAVAHLAASLVPSHGVEQVFLDSFPQGIMALAELD